MNMKPEDRDMTNREYVIRRSNIASIVRVQIGEGNVYTRYIYMSKDKPVEASSERDPPFEDLPPVVQEEINNWFAEVFALPVEERGAWVKSKPASSVTI